MKRITLAIIVILILLQDCANAFNGVKIIGDVRNSNHEYVILAHRPLSRGNLNPDGFISIGNRIDDKGNFSLISDKLIDAAGYWIQVKDKAYNLILFNGDNLKLDFDLNNLDSSFFAQGIGAGKINVLRLPQFDSNLMYDTKYTMCTYKSLVDSTINSQLMYLDLIYKRDIENEKLLGSENKQAIFKIIKDSPLSEREYDFLKKKVSFQDIYFLGDFPSYLSDKGKIDTIKVDFTNPYYSCFNTTRYKEFLNINNWQFEDCINTILRIEYLKYRQKENSHLTYKDFRIDDYSKYRDYSFSYAKNNFNPEVFDMYYTSAIFDGLSMGNYNNVLHEKFVKTCSNNKYLTSINRYLSLFNNGLNEAEHNLSNEELTLNPTRFDSLINSYIGKDLYLVLWSAQFAGSTIISELPSVLDFEKENKGKIKVLYVCIDETQYKNLWATRILDNSWNGNHYFLPAENNDSLIKHFAAQNISSFCDGGATYSFIDKKGIVTNRIEAPILMTKEEIERYMNNTVR